MIPPDFAPAPGLPDQKRTIAAIRDALAQALGYGRHAQRKILDTLAVKDVMATDVVTTSPNTSLVEAARLLTERKIGCLPVVENGRLVGILTEGDFVAMIARGGL